MARRWGWLAGLLIAVAVPPAAHAQQAPSGEGNRFTILEENDSLFFNSDKHYTQGLRLSDLLPGPPSPGGLTADLFGLLGDTGLMFAPGHSDSQRISLFLGQSVFTPKNKDLKPPDPKDRPYAGWLYVGGSLLQQTRFSDRSSMLENAELDFGMVGPGSLGKQVQNDFHQLIGADQAKGWSSQLQQEFGGMVNYERLYRLRLLGGNNFGVDIVPQAGVTAGNIFSYADVGGMLRVGKGLDADYGPVRVRPALSGTDYYDPAGVADDHSSFYFFVGTQGRAVARDIFLDGNTGRTSRSVPKKTFVGDAEAGVSYLYSKSLRFDLSVVLRSEEFHGQHAPDDICTAAVSFNW